jgi:hypothetical protein
MKTMRALINLMETKDVMEKIPRTFYHGSNIRFDVFTNQSDKFALLGKGIYFYAKVDSASDFGKYVYRVKIPNKLKIAPLNFRLSDDDLKCIFDFELPNCIGIYSPIWWATDGWYMINADRKETIEKVINHMQTKYNFNGMLADYPNGGLVLVLWTGYNSIKPSLIYE